MDFAPSERAAGLIEEMQSFMDSEVYPAEPVYEAQMEALGDPHGHPRIVEDLKASARSRGLWNLFMPHRTEWTPDPVPNLDYAHVAELSGRSLHLAPEAMNCSAPDTGNMETIERYGSEANKDQWLEPLLKGEIRSAFLMTEPAVASSDATNIECRMERQGDEYVINGRKWWSSGAGDPRCAVYVVMGKTDPEAARHAQQSMILVPANAKGVKVLRPLTVFGYDDAPHGHMEVELKDVRVPADNLLMGEGKGFAIAQGRLGPGRIHHCMRSIGAAERALELMCRRLDARVAFGKPISQQGVWRERIAESRCMIEQARLLTLKAAYMMDTVGNKVAQAEIAMIKIVAPNMATRIIDWAMQAYGGAGISGDTPLAYSYAHQRTLRFADGPDEVHRNALAKLELARYAANPKAVEMPITRGS